MKMRQIVGLVALLFIFLSFLWVPHSAQTPWGKCIDIIMKTTGSVALYHKVSKSTHTIIDRHNNNLEKTGWKYEL